MKSMNDFNLNNAQRVGGQTGSVCVTLQTEPSETEKSPYYQLKYSILANKYSRQLKAGFTDKENFGEVIASYIGRALWSDEHVPEVSLVYDDIKKQVNIASLYLGKPQDPDTTTLDHYGKNKRHVMIPKRRRHLVIACDEKQSHLKGVLHLESNQHDDQILKQDLSYAVALSAIVGDHDVNPGNMIVFKDKQNQDRIGRIDMGHAFNELLAAPRLFGGGAIFRTNSIFDFFNRMRVSGIKIGGDRSKLKRDYRGLFPSMEMVTALRTISSKSAEVEEKINEARAEFEILLATLNEDEHGDAKNMAHVKKSLASIYKGLVGNKLSKKLSVEQVMSFTFEAISSKIKERMLHAEKVANVMELQLEIEKTLASNNDVFSDRGTQLLQKPQDLPLDRRNRILWVGIGGDKAFRGDAWSYIHHRNQRGAYRHISDRLNQCFYTIPSVPANIYQSFKKLLTSQLKMDKQEEKNTRAPGS